VQLTVVGMVVPCPCGTDNANTVRNCTIASVGTFVVLLILLFCLMNVWPYYLNHLVLALLIFFLAAGAHHAVVYWFKLSDGNWLMGFFTALPFYLSREIRDSEKLGYWDWPGLLWPTLGILLLSIVLESGSAWLRWRRAKQTGVGSQATVSGNAPMPIDIELAP